MHPKILLFFSAPAGRHSVSSVHSVDCKKFVCVRVHSWFIINELVAANGRPKSIRSYESVVA